MAARPAPARSWRRVDMSHSDIFEFPPVLFVGLDSQGRAEGTPWPFQPMRVALGLSRRSGCDETSQEPQKLSLEDSQSELGSITPQSDSNPLGMSTPDNVLASSRSLIRASQASPARKAIRAHA